MMYSFVIHRSRDIHHIPVWWYYQTGNKQNADYNCCVGFYPALYLQDDQICYSETKVSVSRLALLIETNVWQVYQLTKHDNRIDPQEAPTILLFRKFLNLQRYTVVTFGDATTGFPDKWSVRNEGSNFILMTRHYLDLGSASDWLNQISHAARPIRKTTHISVVTRYQYGISVFLRRDFAGKPVTESRNVGCSLKLLLGPRFEYARGVWKGDLVTN